MFAVRGDEQAAPRLEHPRQLGDPERLPGRGEVGEDRECVDQIERGGRVINAPVQAVDAERGERQARRAPGDELGVIVGPVQRRTLERLPVPQDPSGPAAEVEDRPQALDRDPGARQDRPHAARGQKPALEEPLDVVRPRDQLSSAGRAAAEDRRGRCVGPSPAARRCGRPRFARSDQRLTRARPERATPVRLSGIRATPVFPLKKGRPTAPTAVHRRCRQSPRRGQSELLTPPPRNDGRYFDPRRVDPISLLGVAIALVSGVRIRTIPPASAWGRSRGLHTEVAS